MSLKVVKDSDAHAEHYSDADLEKAKRELREEAKRIVKDIDDKYWDLGRCLYDVYDGVPGGYRALMSGSGSKKARQSLFEEWGYRNFGEYCENEVGIRKRTGENIRYAYYWFAIHLDLQDDVIDQLKSIGRSKVYQLSGVANHDNITLWIDKAKDLTFEDLKKEVKKAKAVAAGENPEYGERPEASGSASQSGGSQTDTSSPKGLPKPEELHVVSTSLYDGQFETWNNALERAKSLSGSEKIGHNLDLICQDFLANNDFSGDSDDDKKAVIAKMERSLGVLMIALDPKTGMPIHGKDLLWKLVEERSSEE